MALPGGACPVLAWGYRRKARNQPCQTGRQGTEMNRHPVPAPRAPDAVTRGGRRVVHAHGQLKIRAGAIAWVAGPVLFLTAQLAAQSAWRTGAWNGLPSTRSAAGWSSQASTCYATQAGA